MKAQNKTGEGKAGKKGLFAPLVAKLIGNETIATISIICMKFSRCWWWQYF